MVVDDDELLMMSPVEGHVAHVLEYVMIRVSEDVNVAVAWIALGAQRSECMLGMRRVTRQSLLNLLVDDDIDLHASLSSSLDGLIESPFLVEVGRSTKEKFRRQPPVLYVDRFFGVLDAYGYSPEVVSTVDIPFDLVVLALREKRLEAVAVTQSSTLLVGPFLMLLVMTMVGIDKVTELPNFVLEMECFDFGIIQCCTCAKISWKKSHEEEHVPFSLSRRPFMLAMNHEI